MVVAVVCQWRGGLNTTVHNSGENWRPLSSVHQLRQSARMRAIAQRRGALALALALLAAATSARQTAAHARARSALSRAAPAGRRAAVRFSAVDARRDDELGPLHPTVQWLPPLGSEGPDEGSAEGSITLPIFPLGSVCYLPFTSHGLNIFEPRYRALYNDILFNGSRRFVVTMVDPLTGRLAKTGVVFYLDELKGGHAAAARPLMRTRPALHASVALRRRVCLPLTSPSFPLAPSPSPP